MTVLRRILCLFVASILVACAAPQPPQGNLGPVQEAAVRAKANEFITQKRWLDAYLALDPALTSTDQAEVERAISLAAQHPELIKAADSIFELDNLFNFMAERGRNVGRDLAIIKLGAYRRVATQDGLRLARANIDQAYERFEKEEAQRRRAAQEKRAAEIAAKRKRVLLAAEQARFVCRDAADCSKAFALTQIFVSENADMKIQTANDTIIETFNPTENMKVGIKAVRFPRAGTSAEIRLSTSCPAKASGQDIEDGMIDVCLSKQERIYSGFAPFMRKNLVN